MCGPLILAVPALGRTRAAFVVGRVIYNFGRIATYCLLGAIFGFIGVISALAGLGRWISIAAGAAILLGLLASSRHAPGLPVVRLVAWIKRCFSSQLQRRTAGSLMALGALNGLLPCGLVYVACAAAAASGKVERGAEFMFAFGLGTAPMMLGIGLAGRSLAFSQRLKGLIPVSVALVGGLLILRGLGLGIPYVSPDLSSGRPCCHIPSLLVK